MDAAREQAANRARVTELAVRLDVQQAANAVDVNRERVQYIERKYLTTARESRDIVLASYRLGAGRRRRRFESRGRLDVGLAVWHYSNIHLIT